MDKKYLNKYESSNTADKNDFIGKKRHESSSEHYYSKDRNSSHFKSDYDKSRHSTQSNYASNAQNDSHQASSYYSQKDDQSYYDQKNKYYSSGSNQKYTKYHSSLGQSQNQKPHSNTANYSSSPPINNASLPASSSATNIGKKFDFSDEKHKNEITNNNNNNNNINNANITKQNSSNFASNQNTLNNYHIKSPDKNASFAQSQSSGFYNNNTNTNQNQTNSSNFYNSSNYYINNNNNNFNSSSNNKYNTSANVAMNNSNIYNQNTSSGNYSNNQITAQNQGFNVNRQFSNNTLNNQNLSNSSNNTNNYNNKTNINNANYYPNQAHNFNNNINNINNSNTNQNWYSNKFTNQNYNNNNNNNNINNPNNVIDNNFNSFNNNSTENLNDENELKQINLKYKYHADLNKLASEFYKQTFDKSFYLKLRAKLDIKENLLSEQEADFIKKEEIEKISEKKLFEKFVALKIKENLPADLEKINLTNKNKEKADDDFCVEIANDNNFTNNNANKYNKIIEDKLDEPEKMDLDISEEKKDEDKINKQFYELISFEEFEKFFFEETNFDYKNYLETILFYSLTASDNDALKSFQTQTALKPGFLISYLAANTKNRKLEKFLKENFSQEKLDAEKNKFFEFIFECEKADFNENEKKEKLKFITDEELNQPPVNEITDEMLKFSFFNMPFHYVQEDIPKEIKEIEINAKRIKRDIYNCENSLAKIFTERLDVKKRLNKLIAKVNNNQDIKRNLVKYKAETKLG